MSGWERAECAWLHEMFASMPKPWPMGAVLMYLRHADRSVRRGVGYWLPADAPEQLAREMRKRIANRNRAPMGRRALHGIELEGDLVVSAELTFQPRDLALSPNTFVLDVAGTISYVSDHWRE